MKATPLLLLAALGLFETSSVAQDSKPDVLARIRKVFAAADANRDGSLDAAEALRAKIPTRDFSAQDADQSGSLSGDEFLIYYRQLLRKAGRNVPAGLDREITRIEAARLEARKAAERAAAARQAEQEQGTPEEGGVPVARAEALVQRLVEGGSISAEEGRDMLAGLVNPATVADDAAALSAIREAVNRARPRVGSLAQSGKLSFAEARNLSNWFNTRGTQAAQAIAALPGAGEGGDPDPAGPDAVPVDLPERRAQQLVKRLADGGTISAEEARDMYGALVDPASVATDATALAGIRDAVNRARPRLGALAQAGTLSADEARTLSSLFNARGTQAAQALVALEGPKDPEGGEERSTRGVPGDANARTGEAAGDATGTPEAQAQGLVRRLVQDGSFSPEEGRTLLGALSGDAATPQAVRQAVNAARPRLGSLVQEGKLTAAEARLLSDQFNARGTAAAEDVATEREAAGAPAEMDAQGAERLVRRLVQSGAVTAREGRDMVFALSDPATLEGDAAGLQRLRGAVNAARPRVGVLVQTGKLTAEEGRGLSNWFNTRGTQAAQAMAAAGEQAGDPQGQAPAERGEGGAATPEVRAAAVVRKLVDEGRISAGEGRVMFTALTDPASVSGDKTQLTTLREALTQVRPRIGELVRQGHLSAEDGRELSGFYDARATAAAKALEAAGQPGARKGGEAEGDGRRPQGARPERASEPKDGGVRRPVRPGNGEAGKDSEPKRRGAQRPKRDGGEAGGTERPKGEGGNTGGAQRPKRDGGNTGGAERPKRDGGNTGGAQRPKRDGGEAQPKGKQRPGGRDNG